MNPTRRACAYEVSLWRSFACSVVYLTLRFTWANFGVRPPLARNCCWIELSDETKYQRDVRSMGCCHFVGIAESLRGLLLTSAVVDPHPLISCIAQLPLGTRQLFDRLFHFFSSQRSGFSAHVFSKRLCEFRIFPSLV